MLIQDLEHALGAYPHLLTVEEVATVLRVHPHSVQRWLRAGQLNGNRVGRAYRVTQADILSWFHSTRTMPITTRAPGDEAQMGTEVRTNDECLRAPQVEIGQQLSGTL